MAKASAHVRNTKDKIEMLVPAGPRPEAKPWLDRDIRWTRKRLLICTETVCSPASTRNTRALTVVDVVAPASVHDRDAEEFRRLADRFGRLDADHRPVGRFRIAPAASASRHNSPSGSIMGASRKLTYRPIGSACT